MQKSATNEQEDNDEITSSAQISDLFKSLDVSL